MIPTSTPGSSRGPTPFLEDIDRQHEQARAGLDERAAEVRQRAEQTAEHRAALVRDAAFRARARAGHPFRPINHEHTSAEPAIATGGIQP